MNKLIGKVAVITGGTRGLGLAIATAFAAEGASVVMASRSAASVDAAVAQLRAKGYQASGLATDVARIEQVDALAEHAVQTFGRLDIWVNNAGVGGPFGPTMDLAPEAFHQVIDTNITGVYHGSRAAMLHFLPQSSGKLINLLGRGDTGPVAYQNAYSASKAWVRSFTRALAEESKGSGVGVFAFNPGMVLTDMLTDVKVIQGYEQKMSRFPAIVRALANPPEVPAAKAVWLASSATDGRTGLSVSILSPVAVLAGFAREGLRALLRRPAPPSDVRVRTIPSA